MIFVDTGAWYSSLVASDADHARAAEWLSKNTEPLLTTDYVLDETLTLLRARGQPHIAIEFGSRIWERGEIARLHLLTEDDLLEAWRVFRDFDDKDWSFTDCTSKIAIERLGITHAFSFDHHFSQFGTVIVQP
jgi:uncharacterized protein